MSKNEKQMNTKHSGIALIKSSQANLEWWINSSHSRKLPKKSYDLILRIYHDFKVGIDHLHQFKRLELLKDIDEQIEFLIKKDPIAQAIDIRIIHNLPQNEILNNGYVIKASPYNITYNG